jgi:uncharacterized protein (DUF1499 family)
VGILDIGGAYVSMIEGNRVITFAWSLFLCLLIISCTGGNPVVELGVNNSKLATCPKSPNCVSSDATDGDHHIEPFRLAGPPVEAWRMTQSLVATLPRTKIITVENNYLHAECRSALFGFVDDLELHLRPEEGLMAVRSAARLGYADFGVNRKRVEQLRSELLRKGVIE